MAPSPSSPLKGGTGPILPAPRRFLPFDLLHDLLFYLRDDLLFYLLFYLLHDLLHEVYELGPRRSIYKHKFEKNLSQKKNINIASPKNALRFDDKNLDTLFALGVSCTNILEEAKAMYYIKQWYVNSKLQQELPIDVTSQRLC